MASTLYLQRATKGQVAAVILKTRHQHYMADREEPDASLVYCISEMPGKRHHMQTPARWADRRAGRRWYSLMPSTPTTCYQLTTGPGGEEILGFLCDSQHRAVATWNLHSTFCISLHSSHSLDLLPWTPSRAVFQSHPPELFTTFALQNKKKKLFFLSYKPYMLTVTLVQIAQKAQ